MRLINVANKTLEVPEIALGCMRIANMSNKEARKLIDTAMEVGINFFEHADIYGGGHSEEVFSKAIEMSPSVREKMIIQKSIS